MSTDDIVKNDSDGKAATTPIASGPSRWMIVALAVLIISGGWFYAPTLAYLWQAWTTEPDYSHGLVVPIFALAMAWTRRSKASPYAWEATPQSLIAFAAAAGLLLLGSWLGVDAVLGWSLVVWILAVFWLLGGNRWLRDHVGYLAFLLFAVPLPYRLETALSYPLQTIATKVSCWLLQSLAQPAIAEGHTVLVHDVRLEVVQACSGLRMFLGVIALACAFLILFARPWWYRVAVLTSALPIAIFVNSLRIVSAALLYQSFNGPTARQWIHDITGWVMIPWAACLFYLLTVYLDNLFVEVRPYEVRAPKKRFRTKPSDQNQSSDSPLGAVTDA